MQRKHTTTACQICRDNKTKCDGVRPVCGSCEKKGRTCEYSSKDDKRKISLRAAVEVLMGHIAKLTSLAVSHGLPLPTMTAVDQRLVEQVCDNLGLPPSHVLPPTLQNANITPLQTPNEPLVTAQIPHISPAQGAFDMETLTAGNGPLQTSPMSSQNFVDFGASDAWEGSPSADWSWQILNDFSTLSSMNYALLGDCFMADPNSGAVQQGNVLQSDQPGSSSTSDDEAEVDIVPRLAARLGGLRPAEDGRLRYYGTASNHHFLGNSSFRPTGFDVQEMQRTAAIALQNAQLDQEIPSTLQDHFVKLFFTWHNPCHRTVDRTLFTAMLAQNGDTQSEYCSPSLIAAICAIGASYEGRYHQSLITFPKSVSEFFADKSKVLLEIELDSPCVSTVQTLLLLSSHEAACGRDVRTWLYSGMAMRLAFDLGLHVDGEPYVEQGLFTTKEAEARRGTFWSCVVVNQLWSFSLGRPFRVDSEELTVKPPGATSVPEFETWSTFNATSSSTTSVQQASASGGDVGGLVSEQWVSLCDELAPVVRILYGCAKISKASLQQLSMQTSTRLLSWSDRIPYNIKISPDRQAAPEVLLLHMAYHNFCILIHRPWTSKGSQPRGNTGPGYRHARRVCRSSASEIASLLRKYEAGYGLRKMHVYAVTIIFSASLILIFGLIAGEWGDETERQGVAGNLNTCFRALDELGQCFECAKHTHEHLLAIQKHWTQRRRDARNASGGGGGGGGGSRTFAGKRKQRQPDLSSSAVGTMQKRSRRMV